MTQFKGKFNRMRLLHHEFSTLINQTSFGWDAKTNTVHALEESWQNYCRVNIVEYNIVFYFETLYWIRINIILKKKLTKENKIQIFQKQLPNQFPEFCFWKMCFSKQRTKHVFHFENRKKLFFFFSLKTRKRKQLPNMKLVFLSKK